MKVSPLKLCLALLLAGSPAFAGFSWSIQVTYDHTKVGGGAENESNFPALISISDSSIKTVANGGKVSDSGGADLLVFSDACVTQIPSELEFYDGTNGVAILWLKISTLSYTVSGTVTICTGNGSPPGRTSGVWSGYLGVYHFPNGTALSVNDSGPNSYNLTAVGSPSAGAGHIDGGIVTASGKYATSPTVAATASVTLSGWLKTSGSGNTEPIFSAVNAYQFTLGLNSSNTAQFTFGYSDGSCNFISGSTSLIDGAWHYLVGTFPAAGDSKLRLYVDGALVSTCGTTTNGETFTSFEIGGWQGDGSYPFVGTLDEVRFSGAATSTGWISTEYNNENSPGNIGSAGFWSFGSWTPIGGIICTLSLLGAGVC
jgi:hypothetical protein